MIKKIKYKKRKTLTVIFLCLLLLYIGALIIPYIPHKKVSDSFQNNFQPQNCYGSSIGLERTGYITDNTQALLYRLKMIEEAKDEIILSTFDFNADSAGKDIMSALYHAAQRGVKVRLIVDGISGFLDMNGNPYFQALASQENIEIKVYNPIVFYQPWKIQARLHDKYLIVDHSMYLLGGRNTTNLFLGDYSSSKNIDRELFVYTPKPVEQSSLEQLREYFENIWFLRDSRDFVCRKETKKIKENQDYFQKRYEELKTLYPKAWEDWNWNSLTVNTNKITLLSNPIEPENKSPLLWYCIHQLMQTGSQVTMYTPYIICGNEMYQDLTTASSQLESLEIITNDVSSGANPWGCTDYLNQKENIWNCGVQVYEFLGSHSSHTKAVLIDDRMSIVGSYNLDMRSTYQDTELMLAVDSKELNATIQKEAVRDKTYSKTMINGEYQYGENYRPREMSPIKKILYAILRIVTIPIRRFL